MNRRAIPLLALLLVLAFVLSDWPLEILFVRPELNELFGTALAISIPIGAFWYAPTIKNPSNRSALSALAWIVLVPSLLIAIMQVNSLRQPGSTQGAELELLNEASVNGAHYRLYRTNCGATCDYGLALYKERDLPLGLKQVRSLWSKYHENDGRVTVSATGQIEVVSGQSVWFVYEQ